MPRYPTKRNGPLRRLRRLVRALGLGSVPASVENAGKRSRRNRAAVLRRLLLLRA